MRYLLLIFSFLVFPVFPCFASEINTVPFPQQVKERPGTAYFKTLRVQTDSQGLKNEQAFLEQEFERMMNGKKMNRGADGVVTLSIDSKALTRPESYSLTITPEGISLKGSDPAGVFYGIQTLIQQLKREAMPDSLAFDCVEIEDFPRYEWRGLMLDDSRHFFGKVKVKQLLDMMARCKLNKFHWHLTDETGWRIEIKKYPKLTTVGAQLNWSQGKTDKAQFYTQDDIREIVRYAADRHIEIIPEIDMPGHATAACLAYPQLSGGGTKEHPHFTFNPGKEEVYAFLTDVLKEVIELFPSKYINIGGDEVVFAISSWEKDPAIQALVKKEGLNSYKDAEGYFCHRMSHVVRSLNRTVIGWDELMNHRPAPLPETNILWWRHDRVNVLKNALDAGYSTIMCPRIPLYFDFIQHKDHRWGRTWDGFGSSEDVYHFPDRNMVSWRLTPKQARYIKGMQGCLWTERIHTPERLDFMTYPRLFALAESAWTQPDKKNYEDFMRRMEFVFDMLDAHNIYYFDIRHPEKHREPQGCEKASGAKVPLDFRD